MFLSVNWFFFIPFWSPTVNSVKHLETWYLLCYRLHYIIYMVSMVSPIIINARVNSYLYFMYYCYLFSKMEIKKTGKISFFKNKTKLYIFRGFYLSHKFIDIIKKFTNHVGLINLLTDSPAVQTSFPKIFVCIFQYFTNFYCGIVLLH
jgi:hypothetical protein